MKQHQKMTQNIIHSNVPFMTGKKLHNVFTVCADCITICTKCNAFDAIRETRK